MHDHDRLHDEEEPLDNHVAFPRLARFPLHSPERILALDVIGRKRAHVCGKLSLPRLLGELRPPFIGLMGKSG